MANSDPASLDNLIDFVLPDPVGWLPLAPVWKWAIALAIVWIAAWIWMRFLVYLRNAYRRQAIIELAAIEADSDVVKLSELLKRTAMTAYGRDPVASLYGEAWVIFLMDKKAQPTHTNDSGSSRSASPVVLPSISVLSDASTRTTPLELPEHERSSLFAFAREWIRQHPSEAASC